MIVYRVLSEQDILAGKVGKVVLTVDAALITAREVADSTRREASIYKYNTDSKGSEFVTSVKAHPSVRRSAAQADYDRRMDKIKKDQEKMRQQHEKFMKEQQAKHEAFKRRMNDYARQQATKKPVKTKYTVAMNNLGLKDGFDHAMLKLKYREAAKKYHPDLGGSPEHFRWVTMSYQYLLEAKGWK